MSRTRRRGVLFCGYYGLGNAGDEAVLAASVELLRKRSPALSITAMSATPAATAAALNIRSVPRMQPSALLAELRRKPLFLSGGGSLLQDTTSLKSLLYYLGTLRLAQLAGCPTMIWSQGIGPLIRPKARNWTASVLRRCHAITVRDAESAELLAEIGVTGKGAPEVKVAADPVFALDPQPSPRVAALTAGKSSGKTVVAVALRDWPGAAALVDPIVEALGRLPESVAVQAWPLQPERDLALAEALASRLPRTTVVRESLTPGEWMALAGEAEVVIAMRLHALIFAAARGVPVLGISYDPKVDSLLSRLKSRPVMRLGGKEAAARGGLNQERLETGALWETLNDVLSANPRTRSDAQRDRWARAAHLREAAGRSAEIAVQLLG